MFFAFVIIFLIVIIVIRKWAANKSNSHASSVIEQKAPSIGAFLCSYPPICSRIFTSVFCAFLQSRFNNRKERILCTPSYNQFKEKYISLVSFVYCNITTTCFF